MVNPRRGDPISGRPASKRGAPSAKRPKRLKTKAPIRKQTVEIEAITSEIQTLKNATSLIQSELRRLSEVNDFLESQINDLKSYFEKKSQAVAENTSDLDSRLEEVRISLDRLSRDFDRLLEDRPTVRKITMPPPITAQLTLYEGEEPLDFQVGVVPGVVETVMENSRSHVNQKEKPDEEVVGVLIGRVVGKTVVVEEVIPGRASYSGLTEVALDPKNLAEIIDRMMREGSSRRVVGWYHSHLGVGVFLSDVDVKTQLTLQQFLYVIALVVDPIKNDYGFFYVEKDVKLPDGRPNIVRFIKKD